MSENILAPDMPWNDVVNHVKSFLSSHAKFGCSLSCATTLGFWGHHRWVTVLNLIRLGLTNEQKLGWCLRSTPPRHMG